MTKIVLLYTLGSLIVIAGQGKQDSNGTIQEIDSKLQFYCDDFSVELPKEMRRLTLTIRTASPTVRRSSDERTASVEILPTLYWDSQKLESLPPNKAVYPVYSKGKMRPLTLGGRVLDGLTLSALPGALVTLNVGSNSGGMTTRTDNEGFFSFSIWVDKNSTVGKILYSHDEFLTAEHDVNLEEGTIGPVALKRSNIVKTARLVDGGYHFIGVRAEDGLGLPERNLRCTLTYSTSNGVQTSFSMSEMENLYGILLRSDLATNIVDCRVVVQDPRERWKPVSKSIDYAGAKIVYIGLSVEGKPFAQGKITSTDGATSAAGGVRVWLIPQSKDSTEGELQVTPVDEKGEFEFSYRKGMENLSYQIAATWDSENNAIWVSPREYSAKLIGTGEGYTLGSKITLDIPNGYSELYRYLSIAKEGQMTRPVRIVGEHEPGVELILQRVKKRLARTDDSLHTALNAARGFRLFFGKENTVPLRITDNKFFESKWISLKQTTNYYPLYISSMPIGRLSTIRDMNNLLSRSMDRVLSSPAHRPADITAISGNWSSSIKDWDKNKSTLSTKDVENLRGKTSFDYKFKQLVSDRIKEKRKDERVSLVLLLDHAFLAQCQEESFNLENAIPQQLAMVQVVVFSESYSESLSNDSMFDPIIKKLREAFSGAAACEIRIINPLETTSAEKVIENAILGCLPGDYIWIPFQPGTRIR